MKKVCLFLIVVLGSFFSVSQNSIVCYFNDYKIFYQKDSIYNPNSLGNPFDNKVSQSEISFSFDLKDSTLFITSDDYTIEKEMKISLHLKHETIHEIHCFSKNKDFFDSPIIVFIINTEEKEKTPPFYYYTYNYSNNITKFVYTNYCMIMTY
jgi:hypothetical protein